MLLHLASPLYSSGQCGNNLSVSTYDTVITGIGYGNFHFSFPQWRPDSGTLISVKVNALVSLGYSFTLKNVDIAPSVFTLHVGRTDRITSPSMATYENLVDRYIGDYPLDPGSSVSVPPFYIMDKYSNTDSITTAVAPFTGFDSVRFTYSPMTYTDLRTSNNSSYSFHAIVPDTVRFSVTYLHCPGMTLATSLTRFAIDPEGPAALRLRWTIENEESGRSYEIEAGRDGQHFTAIGSLPSVTGNNNVVDYQYGYSLSGTPGAPGAGAAPGGGPAATWGKWYFRLKMNDGHGGWSYSGVREFDPGSMGPGGFGGPGGLSIWPNPATDHIDILFGRSPASAGSSSAGNSSAGNWQVGIFDAGGNRVQTDLFLNVHTARLNFRHLLAAGAYFIRATDRESVESYTASFLVR
jgi:hypothetical protein